MEQTCIWDFKENRWGYETECGNFDGYYKEKEANVDKTCPYCGRKIKITGNCPQQNGGLINAQKISH